MNLSLVTTAYAGYGQFLPQWCQAVAEMHTQPAAAVAVLGQRHGLTREEKDRCRALLPRLRFVGERRQPNMGMMRNAGLAATTTEWVQFLSVDDVILPWAMEEYDLCADEADFISIAWESTDTWIKDSPIRTHKGRTPWQMVQFHKGRGFINNQSPYRRSFWERAPYMEHDYPNAPFVAGLVELGARFRPTERPCTRYLRRLNSHAGLNLGRRKINGTHQVVAAEKRQALYWKADMERRIRAYYGG